jgi:hypothetical protein
VKSLFLSLTLIALTGLNFLPPHLGRPAPFATALNGELRSVAENVVFSTAKDASVGTGSPAYVSD